MTTAMTLNLRHLKAFIAVVENGGVTRAAAKLNRSQSAITRSILELEEALGVELFERRTAGMVATPFGNTLFRRACRAAEEFERARADLAELVGRDGVAANAPVFAMQVDNRRLAAFVALVEHHNMTAAADTLGITQPAVSASIRELEASLDTPLFDRTPKGMLPTPAAEALALRARLAFAELRHARDDIAALQGVQEGRVAVGALPFGRTAILPRAINRLLRQYPNIRISTVEGPFDSLAVGLRSGDLDFIFGALRHYPEASDLAGECLIEDALSVVVRRGHPLAAKPQVTAQDLSAAEWVLGRRGTPGRTVLEHALSLRGVAIAPNVVETASLAVVRALLMESDRLTAISRHQIEYEIRFGMLAILPVPLPETARPIGVTRRAAGDPSPAAALLMDCVRDVAAELTAGQGAEESDASPADLNAM